MLHRRCISVRCDVNNVIMRRLVEGKTRRMTIKRLQNRIAESRYALPLAALYVMGVWYLYGAVEQKLYIPFATLIVSTYLMVELNNANALIRIYSRMVSCSFLMLTTMASFLFSSLRCELVMLCVITFYTIILHTYQDKSAPGLAFYAFLSLGIASVIFVKILFFVPFLWLLMGFRLLAFSPRMFIASLLGLIAPYWFILPWCFYRGDLSWLTAHFTELTTFEQLFGGLPMVVDEHLWITIAFVIFVSFIGIVHFLRNSSMDKIRTQMIYEMLIILQLLTITFAVLQPSQADVLLGILIINASILIAHFIALTNTKLTNIMFCILVTLVLLITGYNLWMPSLLF